jgi:flagellar hook-length control protein FliK
MAGMAVAPSLLSGINLAAKVIDRLTTSDTATQIENVSTTSGVSGITKSALTDSANAAINAQDTSKRLPEAKTMMDAAALNDGAQDINQAKQMNMTEFTPEIMGAEVTSENDLRNSILQNAKNSASNNLTNNNESLLASNLVDLENQLAELKIGNSVKLNNSISAAATAQRVLASDLALDTTNQNISINNIGNNLRTPQVDSVNVVELKPPVSSPDWGPALNQRITWMVANSLQNANITVNPPNLGPLEINIQTDQNKTNVQFIVTSSEVRQAIQDSIPALSKMFENSGLQLGQADINSRSYNQNRENAKTDIQIKNIEALSNQVESGSIQGQGLINTYV